MNQDLITKYRPNTIEEYMGNRQLKHTIKKMIDTNKIPHAMLLTGNSGSGKTTLARLLAKQLGAEGFDIVEFNIADTNGVDSIRDLIEQAEYKPLNSKTKVYILDEAHQMTTQGQNALLKTLEEPKPWCYFILCTTDPQKLLQTIKSRTTTFQVKPLEGQDFVDFVDTIYCKEKDIPVEESPLSEQFLMNLLEATGGEPRSILSNLSKIVLLDPKHLDKFKFENISGSAEDCELAKVLFNNGTNWNAITTELKKISGASEYEGIRRAVIGYASAILLKGYDKRARLLLSHFQTPFFVGGTEKAQMINSCVSYYECLSREYK